jgi:HEAT repeat protein
MAQEAAARALAKIGDQGVVISLIQTLERLWWLWRSACFLVGNKIKTEEVIRALQDEEEVIRLAILHAVYNRHLVKGSLNTKLAYLSVDSTSFSKLQPEAVGALVNTMDTLDTIIDCSALGHVIGLIKIRSDEERLVEKAIVQALGRLGGGHAKKILTWVCDNSDGLLREIAVAAIEQVEEPETKPEKQAGLLLFCCACGKNLTGTPAMVDRNTDAVYCDKHASSYHSSFRGKFRSCRRCGYRYHLEAGSQIRTCPNCGTALSPGTDPE